MAIQSTRSATIPNRIFLGIPARVIRPKYELIAEKLKRKYPISFVIVGRNDSQDAEELLEVIKNRLETSSFAIFDATSGNANVSLEFGYAEAKGIQRAIYLSVHGASKRATKESAIIADLVGKKQNRYTNVAGLERLLRQFCAQHSYTKRFELFMSNTFRRKSRGEKKRIRSLCLKLIHQLDREGTARRADVIQNMQADPSRYVRDEIEDMILRLHTAGLIDSIQGPYSTLTVV